MGKNHDVTVPLSGSLPTFPGDPPFGLEWAHRIADGRPYNVSRLVMGSHSGTHVDAPFHFEAGGATVDALPLEILIGPARVVEVRSRARIDRSDLVSAGLAGELRVLLKTRMSGQLRRREFQKDYVYLAPDAARWLAEAGTRLVGIDYLSVEEFGREDFATHHELLGRGVVVIEGLDLSEVGPGTYEMTCLPLRIAGAEGAPARVVLREA